MSIPGATRSFPDHLPRRRRVELLSDGDTHSTPVGLYASYFPTPTQVVVVINGVDESGDVDYASMSIEDNLNEQPNTCTFKVRNDIYVSGAFYEAGFYQTAFGPNYRNRISPQVGQNVKIGLGSIDPSNLIFGGVIVGVEQGYEATPTMTLNIVWTITCVDYTWLLNRRRPYGQFTAVSATTVILSLMSSFSSGISVAGVPTGLAAITITLDGSKSFAEYMTDICNLIGYHWMVDYTPTLQVFITATGTAPTAIDASNTTTQVAPQLSYNIDLNQVRTRVIALNSGSQTSLAIPIGQSYIPLLSTSLFDPAGATAAAGPQRLTYTGIGSVFSANLDTWTAPTPPDTSQWTSVVWATALNLFVAVSNTSAEAATSPDGVTWTLRTAPTSGWFSVTWSPTLSLLVAVGGNKVMTSPDGINWTSRTAANAGIWVDIVWAPSLSLFVVIAVTGGTGAQVMTSPDGINWTSRAAAAAVDWESVAWSPSLSLFAAVSLTLSGTSAVMTSPDGINWTLRTTGSIVGLGIAWSPTLNLFVIVSYSSNPNLYSSDGINWTAHATVEAQTWIKVTWADYAIGGAFVAIAVTSNAHRIMVSTDGILWTTRVTPDTGQLRGIAYSSTLGAVSVVGDIIVGGPNQFLLSVGAATPVITGIPTSGAGSVTTAIPNGTSINSVIVVNDLAAQAALALLEGGDGIHEYQFTDTTSLTLAESQAQAQAQLNLFSAAIIEVKESARDRNTVSGRMLSITLPAPISITVSLLIQQVRIDHIGTERGQWPLFNATASSVKYTLQDFLRQLGGLLGP